MKLHPLFRRQLEGGQLLEWGAKTIPEGGYYALPDAPERRRRAVRGRHRGLRGCPVAQGHPLRHAVGDVRGARRVRGAQARATSSAAALASYDRMVDESYIVADLRRTRNMRLAFKDGLYVGGVKAGLMTLTGGRFPGGRIAMPEDARRRADVPRREPFTPDGTLTFGKVDAVFKSGNATRDTIPSHLLVGPDVTAEVAEFYSHVCPAGVYERVGDELRVNAAQLRRLQGDRRARTALDAAGRRQRAEVPQHVNSLSKGPNSLQHLAPAKPAGALHVPPCPRHRLPSTDNDLNAVRFLRIAGRSSASHNDRTLTHSVPSGAAGGRWWTAARPRSPRSSATA